MKKSFIVILCILFGCSYLHRDNSKNPSSSGSVVVANDSFIEFIDHFMLEKEFQMSRTLIKNWKYKNYYYDYEFSLFFDNSFRIPENQLINETGKKKFLSIIDKDRFERKDLEFDKKNDKWFLQNQVISKFKPDQAIDFESFLYYFSTDSLFQNAHIKFPLKVTCTSSDIEDTTLITNYITRDSIRIYDLFQKGQLVFFHDNYFNNSKEIRIYVRGNECGILLYFYFRKMGKDWFLVEVNDFSN